MSWNFPGIISRGCSSVENALFILCGQPSFITCVHNHWSGKIFWKFNLSQGCRLVGPCIMQTVGTLWPSVFVVWWILNSVSRPLLAKACCISLWGTFCCISPLLSGNNPPPPHPPPPRHHLKPSISHQRKFDTHVHCSSLHIKELMFQASRGWIYWRQSVRQHRY